MVAVEISSRVEELRSELGGAVVPLTGDVSTWDTNRAAPDAAPPRGTGSMSSSATAIFDGMVPLEDIPGERLPAAFHELFTVNVLGRLLGVRDCTEQLIANRGAVIISGSFAGTNTAGGDVLYTASKHALHGITALGQTAGDAVLDGTREVLPLGGLTSTRMRASSPARLGRDDSGLSVGGIAQS